MVVDASSRKVTVDLTAFEISQPKLVMKFARMGIEVVDEGAPAHLSNFVVESGLATQLKNLECILESAEELCR